MTAIALLGLVGAVALTADIGRVIISGQYTQNAVDAAACAAAHADMSTDTAGALQRANAIVSAQAASGYPGLTLDAGQATFYKAGDTVPGYRLLTGYDEAVTLTVQDPVRFLFAPILGLYSTTVTRRATVARLFAANSGMAPMWIGIGTPCQYGIAQDLHQADNAGADKRVPGNFGWLDPPGGVDWNELLCGYNVPLADILASFVKVGDILSGLPGQKVGQWTKDLGTGGNGRLARATWSPWNTGTFANHRDDDPRILVVPMVEYVSGNGSNAGWKIDDFGVFWLEEVGKHGSDKYVTGRFIDYCSSSGADGYQDYLGSWSTRIVR
jgi:hypothetical protein